MSNPTKVSKEILTIGTVSLYQGENDYWYIEEPEDIQSYDTYESAKADFDSIVDHVSLATVFGWK